MKTNREVAANNPGTDAINASASFYGSKIGKVNAQIMGASCAEINSEMIGKHGNFASAIFMGLGDGSLIERIAPNFQEARVIEASDVLVEEARLRFENVTGLRLINSYFEAYNIALTERVSCILGNHVLEHVDDPVQVLRKTREWLLPDGIAIFTVPNATSLHRRIGVELGMLKDVASPNEQDRVVGHQRVYDSSRLHSDVVAAGFSIAESGGFNLKLVSQAQMLDWPEALHSAIYRVSRGCEQSLCSNLFVVCRPS